MKLDERMLYYIGCNTYGQFSPATVYFCATTVECLFLLLFQSAINIMTRQLLIQANFVLLGIKS